MSARPFSLLIAALGGEGGGVLTDWIVAAAESQDLPVQSTSIPGVAQRTGATTYYVEIFPTPHAELGGRSPVLALAPGVGDVDMVVASELLEAGRAISLGFVTTDRTLLLASTSRVYLTVEKMQMADGRYDFERLIKAVEQNSKAHLLFDMEAAARQAGAIVNSVMLGAIAGAGRLPIPVEAFEAAIRADGKAVESNLKGFRAGLAAARDQLPVAIRRAGQAAGQADAGRSRGRGLGVSGSGARDRHRRRAPPRRVSGPRLCAALPRSPEAGRGARQVARRNRAASCGAHVVRGRHPRRRSQDRAGTFPPHRGRDRRQGPTLRHHGIPQARHRGVVPGAAAAPARAIVAYAEKRGWLGTVYFGMELKTTTVWGYLRFWALAKLKRFRPKSWRFAEEQIAIEAWLARVVAAAKLSPDLALEIAECARLIKGYGDTWKRGSEWLRRRSRRA